MADFLFDAGTNGFIVSPYTLLSTELNSLANANAALSSVGGSSGVFNQSHTGGAMLGALYLTWGNTITPSAGGYLLGWFVRSPDGGTTFEKNFANLDLARPPDFSIPLRNSGYASGDIVWASDPEVRLPPESHKVYLYNGSGSTLPATGNLIKLAPVGIVRA